MSPHRRPEAARVGGLERAASPAEECGREKGEAPARAEWRGWRRGRGAAGAD